MLHQKWVYSVNNCEIIWIYCALLLVMLNNCWIIWIHLISGKFYYIYKQSFIVFSWIGIWFYKPAIIRFTKNKYTQWIIVELYEFIVCYCWSYWIIVELYELLGNFVKSTKICHFLAFFMEQHTHYTFLKSYRHTINFQI